MEKCIQHYEIDAFRIRDFFLTCQLYLNSLSIVNGVDLVCRSREVLIQARKVIIDTFGNVIGVQIF